MIFGEVVLKKLDSHAISKRLGTLVETAWLSQTTGKLTCCVGVGVGCRMENAQVVMMQ